MAILNGSRLDCWIDENDLGIKRHNSGPCPHSRKILSATNRHHSAITHSSITTISPSSVNMATNTATQNSPPPEPADGRDSLDKNKGEFRFEVTALSLVSLMLAVCLLQSLATCDFFVIRLLVLPCALFLAFFAYEWIVYFSDGLTRRKRAYFDVKNILETYQPRRNTDLARQFKPDPPTPNVTTTGPTREAANDGEPGTSQTQAEGERPDFNTWRKHHYENEYTVAMQGRTGEARLYDGQDDEAADQPPAPDQNQENVGQAAGPEQSDTEEDEGQEDPQEDPEHANDAEPNP